jgi:uncharacterized protein DUF4350
MPSFLPRLRSLVLLLSCLALPALTQAADLPLLLFDQGHDQRFVIEKPGELQLSRLAELCAGAGFRVASTTSPLTGQTLAGARALVISGPFAALTPGEVAAIDQFVANGGRLAIMLHIGQPVAELLHRLGVDFSNSVLLERENIIGDDPKNFQVRQLNAHPLTAGLDHFSLYGGWALMNLGDNARIIAQTSPRAWVDLDGDRQLTDSDAVQAFGVVVAGSSGQGRFVVFGDDAIFQNQFLDDANLRLARNLAQWLR